MIPQIALAISIVALGVAVLALLVALGTAVRIPRQGPGIPAADGLPRGADVPIEALRTLSLESLDAWTAGPSLVIFSSGSCEPCRELVNGLNAALETAQRRRILFIEGGAAGDMDNSLRGRARFPAVWRTDPNGTIRDAFMTRATPSTFLIHESKVVGHKLGPNIGSLLEPDQRTSDGVRLPGTPSPVAMKPDP